MTVGRAKWGCLGLVVCVVWSVGGVGLAAELSEAAQAKLSQREVKQYQRHAIKALEAKDAKGAIRVLKKLETVMSERRWEFLYVYGTLLVEYGATAEVAKGHDMLVEVMNKIEEMGKEDDPYYQPYYEAALDRDYALKQQEEAAFGRAEAAGTAAAYAEYLAAYPQGPHAEVAAEKQKKRAAEEKKKAEEEEARRREDDAAFARAEAAGTAAAYAAYLAAYPQGRHAEEARRAEAERQRQAKLKEALDLLGETMVHVSGGTFKMGCPAEQDDCYSDEEPVHRVRVSDFEIGRYEVTQAVWEAVMGENPSHIEGCLQCPVESVSWEDVQEFLDKLNDLTGGEYRLPTEAEWEYAARGGRKSQGYRYAGSGSVGVVGWYAENSGGETHPVGQKRPNELGLYDMSGNVWEWTQDCWHEDYRGAPSDGSAWESGECAVRVLRGGSWGRSPRLLRSAVRIGVTAGFWDDGYGFRLARTLTS